VFYVFLRKLAGGKPLEDKHGRHAHIHGPDERETAREQERGTPLDNARGTSGVPAAEREPATLE
jgi:multidrug efflux pump